MVLILGSYKQMTAIQEGGQTYKNGLDFHKQGEKLQLKKWVSCLKKNL